ncbi:hypothetical protein ElyMa_003314400 [Elysia marginata]|uniref:Uncharacterized protein n=1 Tax=Elysia marginata TaxID=1093978 RepID=A0AAV4JDS5_9GAST|nr:hypothetical protein ElyMa_003314400 [Elysia marginata]
MRRAWNSFFKYVLIHLTLIITFILTVRIVCARVGTGPSFGGEQRFDGGVVFATASTSSFLQLCDSFGIRLVQGGAMLVKTVCFNKPVEVKGLK